MAERSELIAQQLASAVKIKDTLLAPAFMARNAIINGNFDIWQRGTSFTNPTTGYFTADRFFNHSSPGSSGAFPNVVTSRQTLTPGELDGSYYYYRVNVDGEGTQSPVDGFWTLRQRIEHGTRYLCGLGKKVTLSFYAMSSISGKKLAVNIKQNYGSGGTNEEELIGTVFNLTSTWTRYSYTFTTNTLVGKTFGSNNDDHLNVLFWYQWGSNFNVRFNAASMESFVGPGNIDIAQVQLCAGDVALPFQPRSFADELALCQRYYEKSYNIDTVPGTAGALMGAIQQVTEDGSSTGAVFARVAFIVPKRIPPTVTIYSPSTGAGHVVFDEDGDRTIGAGQVVTGITQTSFQSNYTLVNSTTRRRQLHYVADAEL